MCNMHNLQNGHNRGRLFTPVYTPFTARFGHPSTMEEQGGLSSSMLVPYGGDGYSDHRQLSDFTRFSTTSRFRLPAGWGVKEVIRADGSRSDKYYLEPGTGVKFRSIKEVQRRINGEIHTPRQRSFKSDYSKSPGSQKMIVSGGKMLKLDDEELNEYQWAIVSSTISGAHSPFNLPDGWVIEEVPRRHGSGADKYYYEPGTGLKFRSLREVERHLKAEELKLDYHRKESNEDRLAIVSSTINGTSPPFNLPDGWVVEEVPRRLGNYNDKYYYEPGTGQKFRSLLAVEKYLSKLKEKAADEKPLAEELSENATLSEVLADLKEYNTPLSKAFKLPGHLKNSGSCKKNISRERDQNSSFNTPPMKINWVLASPGGDSWNPFIGDKLVPESVKQQWAKRFMLMIDRQDIN